MGRKDKSAPASSAKSLEVCGTTSNLGVSAADVFAQFASPATSGGAFTSVQSAVVSSGVFLDDSNYLEDAELATGMQLLQKKDPKSRLRGVTELREALLQRTPDSLKDPCSKFLNLYQSMWLQEGDPRVREGLQRCLHVFVEKLQKDFAKFLRQAFPTWLCAMFDTHAESAQAARQAFRANFTTDERRRGVFRHCQAECLDLFTTNLRHTEQSLHESLGMAATIAAGDKDALLQRQDRYIRAIVSTLSGLAELVPICSTDPSATAASGATTKAAANYSVLSSSDVEAFFASGSSCGLWAKLSLKQPPLIRRAAAEALARLLKTPVFSPEWTSTGHRSAVLGTLADEGIPSAVAVVLLCAYSEAGGDFCWEGLNASKALWPNLLLAVKRGAIREAVFLERLPALVEALPKSAAQPGKVDAVLIALLEATKAPRALSKEVWSAYFGVIASANTCGLPVSGVVRWLPVKLYLGIQVQETATEAGEPLQAASTVPESTLVDIPKSFSSWLPKLLTDEQATTEYLNILSNCAEELAMDSPSWWTRWAELLRPLMAANGDVSTASSVRSLLASAARRLFDVLAAGGQANGGVVLNAVRCLAAFLAALQSAATRDWAPLDDDNLRGVPDPFGFKEQASAVSQEAPAMSLLLWPLLPMWSSAIVQSQDAKAAVLGAELFRPLIGGVLSSSDKKDSVASQLRDLLVEAALAPGGASSGADATAALTHLFQASPPELEVGLHPAISKSVEELVTTAATAATKDTNEALDEATQSTVRAAMLPGQLPLGTQLNCLRRLLGARSACLALACKDVILSKTLELEASEESKSLRIELLDILLMSVMSKDAQSSGTKEEAWQALPGVISGLDLPSVASKLGIPPDETDGSVCLRTWLLALQTIAKTLKVSWVAALACSLAEEQPKGAVYSVPHLERRAVAIAEAFLENSADSEWFQHLERGGAGQASQGDASNLMWEVFLAEGLQLGGPVVSSVAVVIRQRLRRLSVQSRLSFLTTCYMQAVQEGSGWALEAADTREASACSTHLHGLSVLGNLLHCLVSSAGTETVLIEDLSRLALKVVWGTTSVAACHATAAVIQRQLELGSAPLLQSIEQWRGRLREATRQKTLSTQLLVLLAHLELADAAVSSKQAVAAASLENEGEADVEDGAGSDSDDSDEIIIVRKPAGQASQPLLQENAIVGSATRGEAAKELPELDTSALDLHEQLLRWAQSGSNAEFCSRGDAFALFVWSTFGSFALASSEPLQLSSRSVVRLHRLLLELFKTSHQQSRSLPGSLRLVSALASRGLWPASSWPVVMEALLAAGSPTTTTPKVQSGTSAVTVAVAAAEVVAHLPASHVTALIPLLGADCHELRAAVLERLRNHAWLAGDIPQGPTSTFGKLKELLEEGEDDEAGSGLLQAPASGASSNDIAFATLSDTLGQELVAEAWNVEEVMGDLTSWEVQASQDDNNDSEDTEEDEETEDEREEAPRPKASSGSDVRDGSCSKEGVPSLRASISRRRLHSAGTARLPPSLGRRCCVTLGAWEVVLQCCSQGPGTTPSSSSSSLPTTASTAGTADLTTPADLAVAALQIAPDQLTRRAAKSFLPQRGAARSKQAEPPLRSLFQLLCQLLSASSSLTLALLRDSELYDPAAFEDASAVQRDALLREVLDRHITSALASSLPAAEVSSGGGSGGGGSSSSSSRSRPLSRTMEADLVEMAARLMLLSARALPAALRSFWERLPRQRDRKLVAHLVSRNFSSPVARIEVAAAQAMLDQQQQQGFPDIRASVVKRGNSLVLMMQRDEHKMELQLTLPEEFPLMVANPKIPEKMVAIPVPRVKNWMRQAKPVLAGRQPCVIGRTMTTLAKSVSLYFDGVEDCPICYSLLHAATQTLPKKACPTCKKKFHNECLYRWWKSSAKTTCPLCNQPF